MRLSVGNSLSPLALVLLLPSPSSVAGFYNRFTGSQPASKLSIPSTHRIHLPLPTPKLAHSLSKTFPSELHQHPSYASVLDLLDSLDKQPSCQRTATSFFISECSDLDNPSDQHGDVKIQYAAQLAICEFEAAGVRVPSECSGIGGEKRRHDVTRCVRKLEERPQWWTTLSNNLQNAMVICAAARHEVDKAKLLELHKNITEAQRVLFKAMGVSLERTWSILRAQDESAKGWTFAASEMKTRLEVFKADFIHLLDWVGREVQGTFKVVLQDLTRRGDEARSGMSELQEVIEQAHGSSRQVSSSILEAHKAAEDELQKFIETEQSRVQLLVTHVTQSSKQALEALQTAAKGLERKIDNLSAKIRLTSEQSTEAKNSIQIYSELTSELIVSHQNLALAQENLARNFEQNRQYQEQLQALLQDLPQVAENLSKLKVDIAKVQTKLADIYLRLDWNGFFIPPLIATLVAFCFVSKGQTVLGMTVVFLNSIPGISWVWDLGAFPKWGVSPTMSLESIDGVMDRYGSGWVVTIPRWSSILVVLCIAAGFLTAWAAVKAR